jgi:hypothetical protein
MEYWASQRGVSLETKEAYQRMFLADETRWKRDRRTWKFYGWQSQIETIAYLETAIKQRRKRCPSL